MQKVPMPNEKLYESYTPFRILHYSLIVQLNLNGFLIDS